MAAPQTVSRDPGVEQQHSGESSCDHRGMRSVRYLRGPRPVGLDCLRPMRVVCHGCGYETTWRCKNHRQSRCSPCATRYRRRVTTVACSGLHVARPGQPCMLTLTAPGSKRHRDKTRPGAPWCECTPTGGINLAEWNASHSRRWNVLRGALRRDYPGMQFFRCVEVQERGALHDHLLIVSATPLDLDRVRELAIRSGFGHGTDLRPIGNRKLGAAMYASKYVSKACDSREEVPWAGDVVNEETGEIFRGEVHASYRTWSSSTSWGLSMKELRARISECMRHNEELEHDRRLRVASVIAGGLLGIAPASGDPPVP